MSRDPAKRTENVALGVASLHRNAPLLQARPPAPAPPGSLRCWVFCASCSPGPFIRTTLDNLSDHMLRDIGIEPDGRERESNVGFWRRR